MLSGFLSFNLRVILNHPRVTQAAWQTWKSAVNAFDYQDGDIEVKTTTFFCTSVAMVAVTLLAGCGGGGGSSSGEGNVRPPTPEPTVLLPAGHGIPAGMYTVEPGTTVEYGNVAVSCPTGGMACVVNVASSDAATATYEETGGTPTVEVVTGMVNLPAGHAIPAASYAIEPGTTEEYGNVAVSCPSGGMACVVNVASSDAATATYEQTGGTPTIETASGVVNLPTGHAIPTARYTIEPGATVEYGNVVISCPSGGMACVLNVAASDAATATYEQTGGTPTIETAAGVVSLPAGHAIPAASYTIEPGATVEYGNVAVSCPAGGMACVVNVASSDAATATYEQTGGTPTVEVVTGMVNLPTGHAIPTASYTIEPGATVGYGNVTISCPSGGMACVLNVAASDAATATYEQTGGTPTIETAAGVVSLPAGHAIPAASYTIEPGATVEYGNVAVSCPSGGMACVLNVAASDAATATYEETGGTPTVEVVTGMVNLPTGHAIPAASYTIEPGATVEHGNVAISCPAGGMACVVSVASLDAATATYAQTGGTPTIETVTGMVNLPTGHAIPTARYTIEPGTTVEYGNVVVSCPAGGMACVLNVASSDAATASYEETGGTPAVASVLIDLAQLPGHHGISVADNVSIEPGNVHHGQHGVSVVCPAGGMACVVDFTADAGKYHKTGGMPEIQTHRLVWAANDQVGRAGSIFTRMNQADEDSGENPVGYRLHNVRTTVNHTGSEVTFEVVYPDPNVDREAREPMLLDGCQ